MPIPSNLSHFTPKALERGLDGYALAHWVFKPEPGFPPELILDPDLWVHVTGRIRVHDQILVIAKDGTFEADLRVMQIDSLRTWAAVRVLRDWPLGIISEKAGHADPTPTPTAKYPDADGYTVEFSGPQLWRIIRGGEVVAKDMPDEETAKAALDQIKAAKPGKRAA